MIKCIAIDMDGTLLTSTQEITKENREAIKEAQDKGVEVVIATGRAYEEAGDLLKEAGIITPMICANGAEIRTNEHIIVDTNPLSKDLARQMAEILHKYQVYYEVYTNRGTYTLDKTVARSLIMDIFTVSGHVKDMEEIKKAAEERLKEIHQLDSYEELFEDDDQVIYKLLAFHFDPIVLGNVREELTKLEGAAISASGKENLEITSVDAQKGIALEKFVKARDISLSDTMAIGDNYNDVSMFQMAGRAVAMGNAVEDIQRQCHFVTGTNEESGVAQAIRKALEE
ncbi:HAD family phosphatase [Niallia circulans]|jgi:Cof subfamily protein (haloacid dehalogenase superfamily)|uniref:Hydrolase n=1 Tax=Niallia circulans TaxID=1397 RepID=A0A268FFJ8_NIACI|nr:Cof-type HAD-IIB family hydrolase [Niallia circulans]AYV68460.1 HAD family phosphatase [Niallia circulans]NRG27009.1 HAD family phosphatase [Niallia circulans]PAD84140.1 hydrolase [Niallia circulans]QJX64370.1 HAD family phosphatase [Niallia circulans]